MYSLHFSSPPGFTNMSTFRTIMDVLIKRKNQRFALGKTASSGRFG